MSRGGRRHISDALRRVLSSLKSSHEKLYSYASWVQEQLFDLPEKYWAGYHDNSPSKVPRDFLISRDSFVTSRFGEAMNIWHPHQIHFWNIPFLLITDIRYSEFAHISWKSHSRFFSATVSAVRSSYTSYYASVLLDILASVWVYLISQAYKTYKIGWVHSIFSNNYNIIDTIAIHTETVMVCAVLSLLLVDLAHILCIRIMQPKFEQILIYNFHPISIKQFWMLWLDIQHESTEEYQCNQNWSNQTKAVCIFQGIHHPFLCCLATGVLSSNSLIFDSGRLVQYEYPLHIHKWIMYEIYGRLIFKLSTMTWLRNDAPGL